MAIKPVLAAISAATSVVGGAMAARSYRQASETERQVGTYNQQLAERDARIKTQQADELRQMAALQAQSDAKEFRELQNSTELALTHNGWMLDSGTPVLQLAYNADQFATQQTAKSREGESRERAALEGAVQARMRGDLSRMVATERARALEFEARRSLLGGVMGGVKVYA